MRKAFVASSLIWVIINCSFYFQWPIGLINLLFTLPLFVIGYYDFFQTKQAIRRNYPVFGNFRYLLESIRPEINQYFIESNTDGKPFSREERSIVYQRAKKVLDTIPFGTQHDVYQAGHEFVAHSLNPKHVDPQSLRVTIGTHACKKPYSASLLNISAMSYGSLSKNAVLALNGGAKAGNFAHNTGEGGISPYHQQPGGDLIWQIGTGYFGCRTQDGKFDADMFKQKAQLDQVKMIELKLSQGAKPGHGGMLPGKKVTAEVAQIRNVPIGQDVNSPPGHSAFSTPLEMMEFIQKLKELSGGKPVGIKLSLGHKYEFIAMAKAMLKSEIHPDFIVVDGSEGGTGAAPLEFTNHIGTPGLEALHFVHQTLRGFNLREKIKIISTGKISSGFGILKQIALGADLTYSARSMMLALGCIQALRCNSNVCPAGVATQKPSLVAGLHVGDKTTRVKNFHQGTIKSLAEIIGAMGLNHTNELNAHQLFKRDSDGKVKSFTELYPKIERGSLLSDPPQAFEYLIKHTSELSFQLSV